VLSAAALVRDKLIFVYHESFENVHPHGKKIQFPLSLVSAGRAACFVACMEQSLKHVSFLPFLLTVFG
jgi:hypothetical protein